MDKLHDLAEKMVTTDKKKVTTDKKKQLVCGYLFTLLDASEIFPELQKLLFEQTFFHSHIPLHGSTLVQYKPTERSDFRCTCDHKGLCATFDGEAHRRRIPDGTMVRFGLTKDGYNRVIGCKYDTHPKTVLAANFPMQVKEKVLEQHEFIVDEPHYDVAMEIRKRLLPTDVDDVDIVDIDETMSRIPVWRGETPVMIGCVVSDFEVERDIIIPVSFIGKCTEKLNDILTEMGSFEKVKRAALSPCFIVRMSTGRVDVN